MQASNRQVFRKRLMFMVTNKIKLPNNREAFAYIGVDMDKKLKWDKNYGLEDDPTNPMSDDDFEIQSKQAGMFVMISSLKMDKSKVLPYYFAQQMTDQIFDINRNYARSLPLCAHDLEAFNGHMLLSFMTTIVYERLQGIFHKQNYNPLDFITELRGVFCGVHDDHLKVYELSTKQKEILQILDIAIPSRLPLKVRPTM
jgi:hypothetical protein